MKRRDFLKTMAAAGAAASVSGGMGVIPTLLTPGTARAAGKNKLIFISDIHMNVDGSYSWFVNHAPTLAEFLDDVKARDDVAELIILGDLLDDWVSPVKTTPQTFADILSAGTNAGEGRSNEVLVLRLKGKHVMVAHHISN